MQAAERLANLVISQAQRKVGLSWMDRNAGTGTSVDASGDANRTRSRITDSDVFGGCAAAFPPVSRIPHFFPP